MGTRRHVRCPGCHRELLADATARWALCNCGKTVRFGYAHREITHELLQARYTVALARWRNQQRALLEKRRLWELRVGRDYRASSNLALWLWIPATVGLLATFGLGLETWGASYLGNRERALSLGASALGAAVLTLYVAQRWVHHVRFFRQHQPPRPSMEQAAPRPTAPSRPLTDAEITHWEAAQRVRRAAERAASSASAAEQKRRSEEHLEWQRRAHYQQQMNQQAQQRSQR